MAESALVPSSDRPISATSRFARSELARQTYEKETMEDFELAQINQHTCKAAITEIVI
jgi:hypothetical protein